MNSVTCCEFNVFAKAMANKTRQQILSLLQAGELNESDIIAHTNLKQPTISHHLSLLKRANLVLARRKGKYIFYHINAACISDCCGEIMARYNSLSQKT